MQQGIKLTSSTYRVNVRLPIDDRAILSQVERTALQDIRRYEWMIVIDSVTGKQYQLQPPRDQEQVPISLSYWEWYILDGNATLSEPLTTIGTLHGIPNNTTFPIGTPLEQILNQLLKLKRNAVLPTVSLTLSPTIVENEAKIANVNLVTTSNQGDSQGFTSINRYMIIDGIKINIGFSTLDASGLKDNVVVGVERNYLPSIQSDLLNTSFPAGIAISERPLNVELPVFIGRGTHTMFANPSRSWFQSYLEQNTLSYRKLLINPTNIITVENGFWNNPSEDMYRWIAIPKKWGKVITSYKANNIDFNDIDGVKNPFTVITEFPLNAPVPLLSTWETKDYLFYGTGYKTTFQYSENELFNFNLKNV